MARGIIDVDTVPDEAFALAEDRVPFTASWHAHDKHQILFAASGTLVLEAEDRRWTLPPQRAAWIRARTRHAASSTTGVALRAVYLADTLAAEVGALPRATSVFPITPLAREMILHAMRWGPTAPPRPRTAADKPRAKKTLPTDPARGPFFRALAALAVEWLAAEMPYFLPAAKTPELARAMAWTLEHLAGATAPAAAAAAHLSVRTLSRRFEEEAHTTFRAYLQSARMMRAMELLAAKRASVSATAYAVGFQSLGAFTTAFTERCGETPSEYRARVVGSSS